MVSTSKKRISIAASALLIFGALSIAPVQSKTRNLRQRQQQQQDYDTQTHRVRTLREIDEVPPEVKESMDPKLIDFVVGGFPKCGTTYLQNNILYNSSRVFIPHHEIHFLAHDKYEEFKDEFANVPHLQQNSSKPLLVGYKAPLELGHQKAIRNLQTLFPDVKMIISLRHPVLQFQSLYNFKLRKVPKLIPSVEEHVGTCLEQCMFHSSAPPTNGSFETVVAQKSSLRCLEGVIFCTGQTNYQHYLSRLGLTPMNTPEELDLLDHHHMSIHPFAGWQHESTLRSSNSTSNQEAYGREESNNTGKLFLIEIGQLDNWANQSMADDVNTDLEDFLGLEYGDLPRAPSKPGDGPRPRIVYNYPEGREELKLDICLERYKPLREILLESSRKASRWILEYLLHPSNRDVVRVSNMDIFERMLKGWNIDPCLNEDEDSE